MAHVLRHYFTESRGLMFDHRRWGRNLEAKTMDWRGVGSLVGRRKGFVRPLLKHWKSCTQNWCFGLPAWTRQSRDDSTWAGCPLSGPPEQAVTDFRFGSVATATDCPHKCLRCCCWGLTLIFISISRYWSYSWPFTETPGPDSPTALSFTRKQPWVGPGS